VVADVLQGLRTRFGWSVGRRLEFELSAFVISAILHGTLLVGLAFAGYTVQREVAREFRGEVVDNHIGPETSNFQDLDQAATPMAPEPAAGTFAPALSPSVTPISLSAAGVTVTSTDSSRSLMPELAKLDVRHATEAVLPTASLLAETVSIKGNGAELVGGVEGAVDRIAVEILNHLQQGRTLVVWAFDASGSLQAERQRLAKHIETIYTHLSQLDQNHLAVDDGLLTMVVAFGKERRALLNKPSSQVADIREAIAKVPLDETGVETTFATVAESVKLWGRYKDSANRPYHTMIIVVTDEVGDDEQYLEDAIASAQKAKVPVYVLGNQALFGRNEGFVNYTDPKTKRVFYNVPVRQGPESAMLEQIHLPFWYNGQQFDIVESGFGPYALSRLASSTGGIYFVTRFDTRRMGFDPARMREYRPDWVRRDQYEAQINKSPLRQAVLNAAQITQQKLPGMPSLTFPSMDAPEFKDIMAEQQATAERTAYTVDEALTPINNVAKLRDRETSRRWQAHFDLIRGRLLAMKVRCYEYNWACARMKKDPPKFTSTKSNAWRLVPDTEIRYSEKAATAAREADSLLRRVLTEHPSTPWALLAQRELKDPLGFKWVETYVPPPPKRDDSAAAKMKKKNNPEPAKPQEVPKL
jgi:hypothetical protein